jgi:hypothetical protein
MSIDKKMPSQKTAAAGTVSGWISARIKDEG